MTGCRVGTSRPVRCGKGSDASVILVHMFARVPRCLKTGLTPGS